MMFYNRRTGALARVSKYGTMGRRAYSTSALSFYRNPFLNYGIPKIPDGKGVMSTGRKFHSIHSFSSDPANPTLLLVFPGLMSGVWVENPYTGGLREVTYPVQTSFTGVYVDPNYTLNQDANIPLEKWRLVSQGVKITLTNNMMDNDGWWECCHVSCPNENNAYKSAVFGSAVHFVPRVSAIPGADYSTQWTANNGYRSGKLRAIDRERFVLQPEDKMHPWRNIRSSTIWPNGSNLNTDGTAVTNDSGADDVVNSHVDRSFDCILIRIWGRNTTQVSTDGLRTQLIVHVHANHEQVFTQGSLGATYHTRSRYSSGVARTNPVGGESMDYDVGEGFNMGRKRPRSVTPTTAIVPYG